MTDDPWGRDEPPLLAPDALPPLPDALTTAGFLASGRRDFPRADELPEVQALIADGWEPFPEAPLYWCVPAAWPPALRGWVPDRLPRIMFHHHDGRYAGAQEWDDETAAMMHDDVVEAARSEGLPSPPAGRRWLLRSPWTTIGVDVVLVLAHRWAAEHEPDALPEDLAEDEVGTLLRALPRFLAVDEEEVWRWWPATDGGEVARRWRAAGRTGRDAARPVLLGLSPEHLGRLTAAPPDGAGLTEPQALAWADAVGADGPDDADEAVRRVLAWRRLGLPADPPGQDRLHGVEPAAVEPWLAAGFDLTAADALGVHGLDVATRWRAAGLDAPTTAALLDADPTLTPSEALAFDAVGVAPDDRVRWVAAGFSATEAAAWAAVDVLAGEARVWRARGLRPGDVPPGPRSDPDAPRLPEGPAVGWFSWGGDPADRQYGVTDPPGTRGRLAAEATDGRPDAGR